ncbi:YdiH family protein [Salmonella enterica]
MSPGGWACINKVCLTLSATELKEEIYFAWRLGVH